MDAERGEGVGKRLPSSNLYGYSRMKYCETDILANLNVVYFSSSGGSSFREGRTGNENCWSVSKRNFQCTIGFLRRLLEHGANYLTTTRQRRRHYVTVS